MLNLRLSALISLTSGASPTFKDIVWISAMAYLRRSRRSKASPRRIRVIRSGQSSIAKTLPTSTEIQNDGQWGDY
ncbi:hypothetical protein FB45DRAFT_921106, partial [Roridomyces roridus]